MGKWIWIVLGLGVLYLAVTSAASSLVVATMTARPFDLVPEGDPDGRVPVWLPQTVAETQPPGTARMTVGDGTPLGVRMTYAMPDGGLVICRHTPFWIRCADGWSAEMEEAPDVPSDY